MTPDPSPLGSDAPEPHALARRPEALDALEDAALGAAAAESAFRQSYMTEIVRLETVRAHAYRRFNFLAALVATDARSPDRGASRSAQRAIAADEFGWDDPDPTRTAILDAIGPLADAVHDERLIASAEAAAGPERPTSRPVSDEGWTEVPEVDRSAAILMALADFEARFEELGGKSFATHFDRHMPDTPLVDF